MKHETITENTIKLLVDQFYEKVRNDTKLAPIFINKIGKTKQDWAPHMERMYNFWSSVMLTTGNYHGNPMKKHQTIPTFEESLFDRWLILFSETAHNIHTDAIALQYVEKSQRIARSLRLALYYKP